MSIVSALKDLALTNASGWLVLGEEPHYGHFYIEYEDDDNDVYVIYFLSSCDVFHGQRPHILPEGMRSWWKIADSNDERANVSMEHLMESYSFISLDPNQVRFQFV